MLQWLIASYILFQPLVYWKSQDFSQELVFILFPLLMFVYMHYKNIKVKSSDKINILFGYICINCGLSLIPGISIDTLIFVISGMLLWAIFSSIRVTKKFMAHIISAIIILNIIYVGLQYLNIDPIWVFRDSSPEKNVISARLVGTFGWENHLGIFATVCLPLMFSIPYMIIPTVILILVSHSSICIVVALIISLIYYWNNRLIRYGLLGISVGVGIYAYFNNDILLSIQSSLRARFSIWNDTFKGAFNRPLQGHGLGSWIKASFRERPTPVVGFKLEYDKLNCQYLRLLFELGFVGLGLVLHNIFDTLKKIFKNKELFCSIVGILLICIFQDPMNYPRTAYIIIVILGLANNKRFIGGYNNGQKIKVCGKKASYKIG